MYSKIYSCILFPAYETLLRKRKTCTYLKEVERSQWFSEKELHNIQLAKLKELLKHASENVPYYRKKFRECGLRVEDITKLEDITRLPYLTKDDIRNNREELVAENYKNRKIFEDITGGSTGTPLQFKIDHNNYEWRQAFVKRVYGWAGYKDGEKTVLIWGASVCKEPFFKTLKHDIDEVIKRHKIYNTFYFTEEKMQMCLAGINRFKPKFIIAYATPLYNLAKFIQDNKKEIWAPTSIIVGAEKVYDSHRKVIEQVFKAPVFETYGCREVTSIAGECEKHNGMHVNMENIFMEIIKNNKPAHPHEYGEIVITDLSNYAMPFIRYKNEDIGSFSDKKCTCGRNLTLLENIEGRILDTIKTSDGRLIPGEFFIYWFMRFEEVRQFQIVQKSIKRLVVKIVKKQDFSTERLDLLKKIISDILGKHIEIDFIFLDKIDLTKSGKFRVVTSEIPLDYKIGQENG